MSAKRVQAAPKGQEKRLLEAVRVLVPDIRNIPASMVPSGSRALVRAYNAILNRVHPTQAPERLVQIVSPAMAEFMDDVATLYQITQSFPAVLVRDEERALMVLLIDELLTRYLHESEWQPAQYFKDEYGIPPERLRKALQRGHLRAIRIGRSNHYSVIDVRRLYGSDMPETRAPKRDKP